MADAGAEAVAVDALHWQGFTEDFTVIADVLRLTGSGRTFAPEEVVIRGYCRFEGASDPDDMSIVYAVEAADGTRGTLVDAFGAYASPAVAAVLDRMTMQRA
jgi:hypothetical protein